MRAFARALPVLLAAAVMVFAVGCGGSSDDGESASTSSGTGTATAAELETVKGAFFAGTFPNLPEAVALDQGFFEEEGVKYEPITVDGGGAQQGAALASGSIDVAPQEVRAVATANAKGGNFRIVVGSFRNPLYKLVMRKDWPMPNEAQGYPALMKDLKGAKIGVTSLGSGTDFTLSVLLDDAGLPDDYVQHVAAGADPRAVLAAMKAGQIDGYMAFEPITSLLLTDVGKAVVNTVDGEGPPVFKEYMSNGLATTAETAAKRSDALKRFAKAIMRAEEFIADPANAQAVADAFVGETDVGKTLPPEVIAKAIEEVRDTYSPYIIEDRYGPQVELLEKLGVLDEGKAPPFNEIIAEGIMPTPPSGEDGGS